MNRIDFASRAAQPQIRTDGGFHRTPARARLLAALRPPAGLLLALLSGAACAQPSWPQSPLPPAAPTASESTQAGATEDAADPASVPPETASRWRWGLTLRNRTGLRLDEPRVLQMSRTMLDAKTVFKINDRWRLTLEGRAHYDPVGRLGYPTNVWLDPRQVLLDGKLKRISLSLGLQQIVWGQADGLRVLDVINPLDYREFILEDFIDSRRPLWAARADVPALKGSLQLVWVPYFAPGRLPVAGNEFGLGASFGLGLISAASGVNLPPGAVTTLPAAHPGYRFSSSQFGARYSRSVGRWDLTGNYFYGWEDVPTNYLRQPSAPAPTLTFAPRYDRKEVIGGTAATNFGPVVLRLEAGWNRRQAAAVTTSPPRTGFEKYGRFSGVVGADYSPRSWLWLSAQYFLQFTSAPQRSLLLPRNTHLASFFVRANFFRETLRPELFILTGLNQREYLLRPRLTRSFGDHWSIGLGADFLGGRQTNVFGYFDARDRAVLELKWTK